MVPATVPRWAGSAAFQPHVVVSTVTRCPLATSRDAKIDSAGRARAGTVAKRRVRKQEMKARIGGAGGRGSGGIDHGISYTADPRTNHTVLLAAYRHWRAGRETDPCDKWTEAVIRPSKTCVYLKKSNTIACPRG